MADLIIAGNSVPFSAADRKPASGTPQYFTSGSAGTSTPATVWPAYAANMLVAELANLVKAGGITPDGDVWDQCWQAVLSMQHFGDVGTINSIVINPPAGLNVTTRGGQIINVTVANSNNGPTFLNFGGFVAPVVRPDGSDLKQNDLLLSHTYRFFFNGAVWVLTQPVKIDVLAGNPNGVLAGTQGSAAAPPDFVWDTVSKSLWACALTGTSSTTSWVKAVAPLGGSLTSLMTPGSGTYTVPAGVSQIDVEGWGGGGGTSNSSPGVAAIAGAGSGGYFRKVMAVTPGQTISYFVGFGGISAPYGSTGGTGGTTTFATTMSATGGSGGSYSSCGGGGGASGGDINLIGSTGIAFGTATGEGGAGGAAPRGAGGGSAGSGDAIDGNQPGGGAGGPGGGGAITLSGRTGGAGAIFIRQG